MSHRANIAIRENGHARFSTDRHGGTHLPDLLFRGPDEVRAYLEDEEPVAADDLYDAGVLEGLLLLDCDTRTVLFDGVSELMFEGAMRRVWSPLLQRMWSDWHLATTTSPVWHLGDLLGLPPSWMAAKASDGPLGEPIRTPLPASDPIWVHNHQTEIQWTDATATWHSAVLDVAPPELLARGPALLGMLSDAVSVRPVDRLAPWGLLRADTQARALYMWTDVPIYRLTTEAEELWPGWTATRLSLNEAARLSQLGERFFPTREENTLALADMTNRLPHTFPDALRRYGTP